jgi:hypothetical protein
MSFDLLVLVPNLSRDIAERFNREAHPALPPGMRLAEETCGEDSTCWEVHLEGDVWAELYPGPHPSSPGDGMPQDAEGLAHELHFPNRGQSVAFHLAADLAEIAGGLVFDPQCVAEELGDALADVLSADARRGYYTPAFTRRLAEEMRSRYEG